MRGEGLGAHYIRTDEADDVAGSVRHAVKCWDMVGNDEQAWKWLALALHSSLQGACVCHLTTTAQPVGAVTKKNAVEWLTYFEASRTTPGVEPPGTYLLTLPELLKAVRRERSSGNGHENVRVLINDQELGWLKRFHSEIRNQFIHFKPQGWSIDVSGVPGLGRLTGRIIGNILENDWAFRHKSHIWKETFRSDLASRSALPDR